MTVRVILTPTGIDELLHDPRTGRLVQSGAEDVAEGAASIAPHGTGHLGRSYKATRATVDHEGVHATAYTDDPAGHLAEWGSANNPPYAPLRRGADRAGLRTRVTPKGA